MIEDLYQLKDLIAAIGLSAAFSAGAAYALFRFFGKNWLESKFKKQLSKFNHDQNKEIARLKIEIDSMLDARISRQKKNFEGLTEIWGAITSFGDAVSDLAYKNLKFDNLELLNEKELEDLCKTSLSFSHDQYEAVKASSNKNRKAVVIDDSNSSKTPTRMFKNYK